MDDVVLTGEDLSFLNSGLFWIIIVGILGITIVSTMYLWGASKHGRAIEAITAGTNRRTLVAVCVVLAIALLGLVKVIPGEDVTILFAAVVGFVFGGGINIGGSNKPDKPVL